MLLTRLPLESICFHLCASTPTSSGFLVRLACLRHAASVHPEPGSNSPKKNLSFIFVRFYLFLPATQIDVLLSFQRTLFLSPTFSWTVINIPQCSFVVKHFFVYFLTFLFLAQTLSFFA